MSRAYIPRLFDQILEFSLKSKGAVVIVGPKWCGKSTTANRYASTVIDLMPLETRQDYVALAKIAPSNLLNIGPKPILIDEWQHISFIWDQIKYEVDKTGDFGQYILTGSVTDKFRNDTDEMQSRHTGNGRIIRKMMRTLSLYETGDSNGSISLFDLKEGRFKPGFSDKTIYDYAYYVCRGGWPLAIDTERDISLAQARDYYEVVVTDDIFSLKDIPLRRDEQRARRIMRSYAKNQGSQIAYTEIAKDISANELNFTDETVASYVKALRKIFVVEDMPAWNPNLRSRTSIRATDTRYFSDSAIAAAALGIGPNDLISDLNTLGLLFETMCVRDLRTYAESL